MCRVLKEKKENQNRIQTFQTESKLLKCIGEVIKQKQSNNICKNSWPVDLHNRNVKVLQVGKKLYYVKVDHTKGNRKEALKSV